MSGSTNHSETLAKEEGSCFGPIDHTRVMGEGTKRLLRGGLALRPAPSPFGALIT